MLNKLRFNNLVITNKSNIQRARAQTIQKLVRSLRKLDEQKDEDASKTQVKQRRIKFCMGHLKRLKKLEIIQSVLLFEKNPAAVLSNEQSLPEERVTAMLAMNKIMVKLVMRFKQELNLKDNGKAKWGDEILAPSRRQEKINKTEQKRQKRKALKEHKAMARKRLEWVQENQTEATITTNINITNSGTWKEEELPEKDVSTVGTGIKQIKAKKPKLEKLKKKVHNNDSTQNIENPKTAFAFVEKEKLQNEKDEVTHEVDSFFFTSTGENYLSTAISNKVNIEQQVDVKIANDKSKKSKMRTVEPRTQQRTNKSVNEIPDEMNSTGHHSTQDLKDLHPSWAAKQKLKPVITAFQGKKITFDD